MEEKKSCCHNDVEIKEHCCCHAKINDTKEEQCCCHNENEDKECCHHETSHEHSCCSHSHEDKVKEESCCCHNDVKKKTKVIVVILAKKNIVI